MDEEFESLVVTDPDIIDEGIDVSGLRTQTDVSPFLLGNIPDYAGIQYEAFNPRRLSDLMRLYSSGLPAIDTPAAAVPPATGGGGSGDGGQTTLPITGDSTATPIIPIEPETFTAESLDRSFLGEEGPATQPLTSDPITIENIGPGREYTQPDGTVINIDPLEEQMLLEELRNEELGTDTFTPTLQPETTGGAPVVSQQLQDQGPTTIEGLLSQVQVPGVTQADLTQAAIDKERLGVYTPSFDTSELTDATPEQKNTIQNILTSAGDNVQGALTQLGKIPGAIVDFANQTVDVFGKKINVGATLAKLAINKIAGGPVSLVFDVLSAILPKDTLEQSTSRNIVNELKAEKDYGFNMQAGNMNQDPFGRNPPAANYEQKLKDDLLGINQSGFQTAKFLEKKQEFAKDYFDKKAEYAGGVEQTSGISKKAGGTGIVKTGDVLGPGEVLPEGEDLIKLDDMLREQRDERIGAGIQAADDDKDSDIDTFDTTPADTTNIVDEVALTDQNIIDRGGGDDIGTGGLDPNRGQQVDRGSSGAGDNQPVSTTTGPPSTGFQPQSTYDAELEDERDVGGGGNQGGDDRGSSKIVCTMMNESYGFGSFRNKIWLRHSKGLAPEYQKGYHKIFLPLVKLSKKNIVLKKILEHVAVHRTIDIRQESRGKVHLLGRLYRKILEPICYFVGKHG